MNTLWMGWRRKEITYNISLFFCLNFFSKFSKETTKVSEFFFLRWYFVMHRPTYNYIPCIFLLKFQRPLQCSTSKLFNNLSNAAVTIIEIDLHRIIKWSFLHLILPFHPNFIHIIDKLCGNDYRCSDIYSYF